MNHFKVLSFFCLLLPSALVIAKPLSDSLPIEGNYSQEGRNVSRFKLTKFLLDQSPSSDYADASLGFRWAGHGVGALLWTANIGMAVYEVNQIVDAIKNQKIVIDTANGMREPFSNNLAKFTIPLTIGTEVAGFVQARLYNRSNYLLHKAALAYNGSIAKQEYNLHIGRGYFGEYSQGGLTFGAPVLHNILMEQRKTRPYAIWSWTLNETGVQVGTWASTFLCYAVISLLQENMGAVPFAIDIKERQFNLTMGISLTVGSITCAIVSAVIRKNGIERYNDALPDPEPPPPPRQRQSIIEEQGQLPIDSAGMGSIETPQNTASDSTSIGK